MSHIVISNIKIDVVRKDIKNIHLSVHPPNGRVRISVPIMLNEDAIRLFTISKLSWIKKQQRKFEGQERQTPREFKDRESHYFLGRRYLLNIIESNITPKVNLRNSNFIDLYVRPGSSKEKRGAILNKWYRERLKEIIPDIISRWEKVLNVEVKEFGIKQMKTRWGTCNTKAKRIWINLELAKKPLHCLEYIIVHEMIHLLERNHNERFLAYMNQFIPQWKKYKRELNKFPVSHSDWNY